MVKALHIVPYEKYIDCVIELWGQTSVQCDYVCMGPQDMSQPYKFPSCIKIVTKEQLIAKLKSPEYDIIVFSSLPSEWYSYVLMIPSDKIVIWQSVGYDIYGAGYPYPPVVDIPLYKPETLKFLSHKTSKTLYQKIRHVISLILKPVTSYKRRKHKFEVEQYAKKLQKMVLNRIDYISTVLDPEFDLLKRNDNVKADFFRFKYTHPLDTYFNNIPEPNSRHYYLLMGNSGDENNNHLDLFKILSERGIKTPLFVPIAYGGEEDYRNLLLSKIKENSKNVALTKFLDRDAYLASLNTCSVAIFGHVRQQALWNIYVMLLHGCKVFLYEDSIAYQYYKKQGLYVFSIERDLTQENIDAPLTHEQRMHNRQFFEHQYEDELDLFKKDVQNIVLGINKSKNN